MVSVAQPPSFLRWEKRRPRKRNLFFPSGMEAMGPVTQKLYETLTGIQMGKLEAPEGWLKVIE